MAVRIPLVIVNGVVQQLQAGDSILAPTATVMVRSLLNGEGATPAVIGNAVYISASGTFKLAKANAAGTAGVFGLVNDTSIAAAASGLIAVAGVLVATTGQWDAVTGQVGGLTAGSVYYLDPSTFGNITATAPTTVGQLVVAVGRALSTTEMEVSAEVPILL